MLTFSRRFFEILRIHFIITSLTHEFAAEQWNIDIDTVFGAIRKANGEKLIADFVNVAQISNKEEENDDTVPSIYSFTGEPAIEPSAALVESDFPVLDDSLDAMAAQSDPIFGNIDGFWDAYETSKPDSSSSPPLGTPKPALLSNIPFLSGLISVDAAMVIALYANQSPMRRPDIGRWIHESRLVLDRDASVITGQLGKILDNDSKLITRGKTKSRAESFKVHKKDSMRIFQVTGETARSSVVSLTHVGIAYAEVLLGSALDDHPLHIKQLLPLSARLRWLLRKYGAQSREEYLGRFAQYDLRGSACQDKELDARGIGSGLANAKGFVSVNDFYMDQLNPLEQWKTRFLRPDLAERGMKIHEEAFYYYLKHDMKGCPTLVLVDEDAFDNFFVQDGEGYKVIREMPMGTLIPESCFSGDNRFYSEETNRELLRKHSVNHVSLHSFVIPSIPFLANQRFYCLGYHAQPGQRVVFSNLDTESMQLPCGTVRHPRSFKIRADKFDVKRRSSTPQSKKRSRRDASPKRKSVSEAILNGVQNGIIPTLVIGGEELTPEQENIALNPLSFPEVVIDSDQIMRDLEPELMFLDTLLTLKA